MSTKSEIKEQRKQILINAIIEAGKNPVGFEPSQKMVALVRDMFEHQEARSSLEKVPHEAILRIIASFVMNPMWWLEQISNTIGASPLPRELEDKLLAIGELDTEDEPSSEEVAQFILETRAKGSL